MKRSTKITITIVLIFGVVLGFMSYNTHKLNKYGGSDVRPHYMMAHISKKLDLNGKQQQKLAALKEEINATRVKLRNQTGPIRNEVKNMISTETLDQTKMIEMINKKTTVINEAAPNVVATLADFMNSLSTEQKTDILKLMEHKRYRHKLH